VKDSNIKKQYGTTFRPSRKIVTVV